jgi:predicted acylesterase/phospholipase RssA
MQSLGIALSGGGSRAAAFHRGTVRALHEMGLLRSIDVISTVSGGSVFGAAWVSSQLAGESTEAFLKALGNALRRGFIRPALFSVGVLKLALPGYNRTHRLADVFSDELCHGRALSDLPERPALCLNTTVLNHGMPGRFSRGGFSCQDVGERLPDGSYPETRLERRNLGFAVAASAAFPFALPPITLDASELLKLTGSLQGHSRLFLTDGGVLENLGVERLLASRRFAAKKIIVSDAGVAEASWAPSLTQRLTSVAAYALTRETLSRLLNVMNTKQNKTMRQLLFQRLAVSGQASQQRQLWFVRIDQTWDSFFRGISESHRKAIAVGGGYPDRDASGAQVVEYLERHGIDRSIARQRYDEESARRANSVETNFTGLSASDLDALERHAMWQVQACRAVYGPMLAAEAGV